MHIAEEIPFLNLTDEGEDLSLKTPNSRRAIPIHSKLIKLGFLKFVELRVKQGQVQLFSCIPTGEFGEWSKNFEQRFSRQLTKLGFQSKPRPTAYSFRHTFSDELQNLFVNEAAVADLMGHKKEGLTFGHYAKKMRLERLKEVVEKLNFDNELASVKSQMLDQESLL